MNHASIFSGIGGAEVAASMMGWSNLFHCEINPFCRRVLDYWFPNSISYDDVTKTSFSEWRGKVDILTGGFPCQPFSLAGKRKGSDDDRYLWPHMLRAIREIQPTWLVAENVAGISSMVQLKRITKLGRTDHLFEENYIYREEYDFTLNSICESLESAGYDVQPIVIPACAIGAPHRRDRVWIVANRSDARIEDVRQERKDDILSNQAFAYTKRCGRNEIHKDLQPQQPNGKGIDCNGSEWNGSSTKEIPQDRGFEKFPTTQPTICGRNDGLPFDVDDLTIPKGKWRAESIKAYGNAWVPQVAYEIFKAIYCLR